MSATPERLRDILTDISADMKADATRFDGQPFTGKTVAEYFGVQGAAIAALADIVKTLIPMEPGPIRRDEDAL